MFDKMLTTALFLALPTAGLAQLSIADLKPDTQVTINGVVERIADEDTFILSDQSGQIEVYLGPNLVPVAVGTAVTVEGIVDDGLTTEIYASRLTTDDGQTFVFEHAYD